MGYRSSVLVAIKKDKITDKFKKMEVLQGVDSITKFEDHYVFIWDYVKWYDDYPDVKEIMGFLNELDEGGYGFIRIGEDSDDIAREGDPSSFDCFIVREFDTNSSSGEKESYEEFSECNASKFIEEIIEDKKPVKRVKKKTKKG